MRRPLALALMLGTIASLVVGGGTASAANTPSGTTIYNSIPSPLPGNLSSQPFQAQQVKEFGDKVTFAGSARVLKDVTITMSSWACQSGAWFSGDCVSAPGATSSVPITVNLYASDAAAAAGTAFASVTQSVAIPYRPSADTVNCTAGRWYDAGSATCFNGKAANVTIDFSAANVVLPNTVIYGISYNTSQYGPNPLGALPCESTPEGCFYDSLNVALSDAATTGTDVDPNGTFFNTVTASNYCDGGAGGTGTFRPDTGCWAGFAPAVRFGAANPAATSDQCKGNGWQTLTDDNGAPFKNQGDCVSFVATKGKNKAKG